MTTNYNAQRKAIVTLLTIMQDEDVSLLVASARAKTLISEATDIIRDSWELPCEQGLHPYIKGERCKRCGKKVEA